MFPLIVPGGVLVLDDYGVFPGETRAVDDYFRGRAVEIRKFPFCMSPCFIVKDAAPPAARHQAIGEHLMWHDRNSGANDAISCTTGILPVRPGRAVNGRTTQPLYTT
jgi:hypothetical protein